MSFFEELQLMDVFCRRFTPPFLVLTKSEDLILINPYTSPLVELFLVFL